MPQLYHLWLSPHSRAVRAVLSEKGIEADLTVEPTWQRRPEFLALNPAGDVPVYCDDEDNVLSDTMAICEYLDEMNPASRLLPGAAVERAEVRRLCAWFLQKFQFEVTRHTVEEKVMKRYMELGQPNPDALRAGFHNLAYHMDYICYLVDRRFWLAGEAFTLAHIAAAAQISCLDYLGDVRWEDYPSAKAWYARVKSRPSFRPLLQDRIGGLKPADHYHDPDF